MKFVQRRGSTVHTFDLGDESFVFAFSDHSGADKAEFSFGGLDKEFGESRELRSGFKRAAWVALATALSFAVFSLVLAEAMFIALAWVVAAAELVRRFKLSEIYYTVIPAEGGRVFVIRDAQHDAIVEELMARRKAQLLGWHGEVNTDRDLESEIGKFRWLVEQEVLDEATAEERIAEAEFYSEEAGGEVPVFH